MSAKILVVSREGKVESILTREGFTVLSAHLPYGASFRAKTELPNMIVLGSDLSGQEALEIRNQLRDDPVTRSIPLLVILPPGDGEGPAHHVPIGANDDYLTEPYKMEVLLLKVQTLLIQSGYTLPPSDLAKKSAPGKVITVFSAKGGVGKTVIACNLAIALRQMTDGRVILMDGNLQFGDLGKVLNINSNVTIHNATPFVATLDAEFLQGILVPYSSGISVLLPPQHAASAEAISVEFLQKIVWHLKNMADYLIIDTPVSYDAKTLALMDAADQILVITMPEISVMANTETFLQLAADLEILNRVAIVINRSDSNVGIMQEQIRHKFGKLVAGNINSDGHLVVKAANRGEPFIVTNPNAKVSRDIFRLAEYLITGKPSSEAATKEAFGTRRTVLLGLVIVGVVLLVIALLYYFLA
ncbi:MAG: P-loop NTPase [Anaerolineae bacterium]